MKKIAVTGGLSCGKTAVCSFLQNRGAYIISADDVVHQLLIPKSPIAKELIELLGEEIVQGNHFNRDIISKKVFNDRETLERLESIIHPAVLDEIEEHYHQIQNNEQFTLFVAEIPLLYEIDKAHLFDRVIAVTAKPEIARKRFTKHKGCSHEEFDKRMNHQLPPLTKSAKANYTIINDGDQLQLQHQVDAVYEQITQE